MKTIIRTNLFPGFVYWYEPYSWSWSLSWSELYSWSCSQSWSESHSWAESWSVDYSKSF